MFCVNFTQLVFTSAGIPRLNGQLSSMNLNRHHIFLHGSKKGAFWFSTFMIFRGATFTSSFIKIDFTLLLSFSSLHHSYLNLLSNMAAMIYIAMRFANDCINEMTKEQWYFVTMLCNWCSKPPIQGSTYPAEGLFSTWEWCYDVYDIFNDVSFTGCRAW